jgi:ubiquinone/menaquinone biosynthesis C-methylase UbiE
MLKNPLENILKESVETVAQPWEHSSYYADAEKWTHIFWGGSSVFNELFSRLDLRSAVELACGHGRHAERCASDCGSLTLIDVFEANLQECRKRLSAHSHIRYLTGNGYDFTGVESGQVTAIYCYDAMVHFSPDLVESYLKDAARILAPGGMALLHHSNHAALPGIVHYGQNPHARNHMTCDLFRDLAQQAGLTIVESHSIAWGGVTDLDRISLLVRPS